MLDPNLDRATAFTFGMVSEPVSLSLFDYGEPYPPFSALRKHPVIEFWGNFYWLSQTDHPFPDTGPVVISRRFVEVVMSLGDATTAFHPVRVHEHKKWRGRRHTEPPWAREVPTHALPWKRKTVPPYSPSVATGAVSDDWFAFVGAVEVECIDWSNVDRDDVRHGEEPSALARIAGVIPPAEGFPPLFVIKNDIGSYRLSGAAKRALEAAGVRGIDYGDPLPIRR